MSYGNKDLTELPFNEVIRKAVTSCTEAQKALMDDMQKYIEECAFTTNGDGKQEVAMLHFTFEAEGRSQEISLPLITVMPPQLIHIRDVEMNFSVTSIIEGNQLKKAKTDGEEGKKTNKNILVRFSPSQKVVERSRQSVFDMRNIIEVNIKAQECDMSGGMARLLELISTQGMKVE